MKNAMRHIGESMVTSTIDISRQMMIRRCYYGRLEIISVGGMPDPHVYNHGSASYVGFGDPKYSRQTDEAFYDLEVGYYLERLGVIPSKSLDSRDRVLFNVLDPSQVLSPVVNGFKQRYIYMAKFQYNTSMTAVADFSITFYYVRNEIMCVLVFSVPCGSNRKEFQTL
uniref:RES domain-containing protein n=1 Tax=Strongyloides venezuelensis TaxID=75913 RepID=A0A0K0F4T6_STRVS